MKRRRLRRAAVLALLLAAGINAATYAGAWCLTHFDAPLPRARNTRTPAQVGLRYERHVFAGPDGALEAWYAPHSQPRALAVLFHGYGGNKSDLLREARAFHALGLASFLVDLRGAGGSAGRTTSIGYHEAEDVAAAARYARELPGRPPLVLYGTLMGAAAVLRAEAHHDLSAVALVVEAPFNRLLATVEHRFEVRRVPAFPWARLLVFWGGWQHGFDGFGHNPAEYARGIHLPTLVIGGQDDPLVRAPELQETWHGLAGPKAIALCPGVAHQSCLRAAPEVWVPAVRDFLDRYVPAGGSQRGGRASS